ncbi:hypothetical protein D0860_00503 [Hortaea werneckii]|uniref:Histidine kinase n=1 Tax=Hortaea werneckii TaxID=91943 RepID=A0A3M7HVN4_HORWE|nr:hypothetical protein D0860_00503 [Hortaea werneckii]
MSMAPETDLQGQQHPQHTLGGSGETKKRISLQEREVHRYYRPWLDSHGSSLNVASHVESIAQFDLHGQGYKPVECRDKSLTAFAQLAVFRLGVKRCMVSLIDPALQYILAEATSTTFTDNDSEVWLGSTILSRPDAVCEHCFYNTCSSTNPDGTTFSAQGLIVNDCRLDPRFDTRPYVVQEPGVRFYAGVPITTRAGIMIGAYAVSDDKPRNGLTTDELRFMQEISVAVMEHLEWARDRVDRFKGERIVRGMASFIENCGTARPSTFSPQAQDKALLQDDPTSPGPRPKSVQAQNKDRMSKTFDNAAEILRSSTLADGAVLFGASSISGATGLRSKPQMPVSLNESPPVGSASDGLSGSESLGQGSQTFHFTDAGSGYSSGDESGQSDLESRPRKRRNMDHKELLKKIPGAKSVTFLPLYDFAEDRLVAGCFLWTSVTGRMMTLDDDLSYLHAFGNTVISEVARINAQKNEAAKTTFIASMSHELRSPLHGILGATEFLLDTASDAYQSGLMTSIMTCGKTLLDTLNHVLDYSKINKLGRAQMRRNAKHNKLVNLSSDSNMESMNMTADVDLGILVEEVVEAVTAGHAFKKQHGPSLSSSIAVASPAAGAQLPTSAVAVKKHSSDEDGRHGTVSVLLDISPRRSWLVRTQPGALRRIIMNLLGNALKYTSTGFVAVSLRAQENPSSSKVEAFIRVCDSGKGISDDFLTNKLFVPFSQEDSFQPGTGLGLSIVKQIVDSLSGTIDVKSQQNMGTEISVHLNLSPSTSNEGAVVAQHDDIMEVVSQLRGKHLVLLDPSADADTQRVLSSSNSRLEATLSEVCTSWFEMRVSRASTMDVQDAEVYMYSEPPPAESLVQHYKDGKLRSNATGRDVPVVVVCVNAEEAVAVAQDHSKTLTELGKVVEVVPQPCGPRKLAQVLTLALRRVEELQHAKEQLAAPAITESTAQPQDQMEVQYTCDAQTEEKSAIEDAPRDVPLSAAVSFPSPPPVNPETPGMAARLSRHSSDDRNAVALSDGNIPHVLVVDDNKINLQLLVMFMKRLKYSYAEAENGLEAFSAFKESCLPGPNHHSHDLAGAAKPFDYVLMDISMPVMNGMEATRRIREFERDNGLKRTTIIALTGLASAQAQKEAENAGIDIFLPKPVKFKELQKMLSRR